MTIKTLFSKKEHTDSGLALLLITLIAGLWLRQENYFKLAVIEVIVLLTLPVIIYPFTFLWLNISEFLGKILSRLILAFVFFIFVLPVALIRRMAGKDSLKLKEFRKNKSSVFTERNHTFVKSDFTAPY